MAVKAGLTINGINPLESELRGRAIRSENMRPVFKDILVEMTEHEKEIWRTHGSSVGRPWPDRVSDPPNPPLLRTRRLYRSLTNRSASGGAIRRATAHILEFGTTVDYAEYIQDGTDKMDSFAIMRFPLSEVRKYNRMMQNYLAGKRRRRFG